MYAIRLNGKSGFQFTLFGRYATRESAEKMVQRLQDATFATLHTREVIEVTD